MGELIVGGVGETGWKISPDFRSPELGIPGTLPAADSHRHISSPQNFKGRAGRVFADTH